MNNTSKIDTKIKLIKEWYEVNRKTIIASFVILFVVSFFVDINYIFAVIFFFSNGVVYLLTELYEVSDNPSVAAFWGAFFAFILVCLRDFLEKRRINKGYLTSIKKSLEMYFDDLNNNIQYLDTQIYHMQEHKALGCALTDPLFYFDYIDMESILKIKDKDIQEKLFIVKKDKESIINLLKY